MTRWKSWPPSSRSSRQEISTWSIPWAAAPRRSRPRSSSRGNTGWSPDARKAQGAGLGTPRITATHCSRYRPRRENNIRPIIGSGWFRWSELPHYTRIAANAGVWLPLCPACSGDAIEAAILREGPETVAALIAEPVGGSSTGASVPGADYWRRVREICDRTRCLLVADEILTGAGRTGTWSALEPYGVVPDIMVLGKGHRGRLRAALGGGGAAPAGRCSGAGLRRVPPCPDVLPSCHRCAPREPPPSGISRATPAGRALRRDGRGAASAACRACARPPCVGDVRGRGLLAAIEFVEDKATRRPFPPSARFAESFAAAALDLGLIVWPNCRPTGGRDRRPGHARAALCDHRGADRRDGRARQARGGTKPFSRGRSRTMTAPTKITYTSASGDLEEFHRLFDAAAARMSGAQAGRISPVLYRRPAGRDRRPSRWWTARRSTPAWCWAGSRRRHPTHVERRGRQQPRGAAGLGAAALARSASRCCAGPPPSFAIASTQLAALMSLEVGKSRLEAMGDAEESADLIDYYCQQVEDADGFVRTDEPDHAGGAEHRRAPPLRRLCLHRARSTFRWPSRPACRRPRWRPGNAVVYKPAEDTPWTGLKLYRDLSRRRAAVRACSTS